MAETITVPRPAPDRVMFVVCGRDGVVAHVSLNEVIVRDSDLEQFLLILRDIQDKTRATT